MARDDRTLDLFDAARPERAEVGFDQAEVRAATLAGRLCKAMALALKDCGKSRDEVAAEMSEYLGEEVSKAMLDAYVSPARDKHTISVTRYAALIHSTGDMRLLGLLPALFGHAVIDRHYLPWVEMARLEEERHVLDRRIAERRRAARRGGRA